MRRWLLAMPLVFTLGCSDLIPPDRGHAYQYHLTSGSKVFSIQWSQPDLPIRVWVDSSSPLAPHVATALVRWSNALIYGELRTRPVRDSSEADIIVRNQQPDAVVPAQNAIRLQRRAPQCSGETQLDIDQARMRMYLPINLYVWGNGIQSEETLTTCYRLTVTHEFGHAFGILRHSPNHSDVMFYDPVLDGISTADRETMETVFHSRPTVIIVPRLR